MKNLKIGSLLLGILLLMTGCIQSTDDLKHQVIPPVNEQIVIQGTWEVEQVLHQQADTEVPMEAGALLQFSNEFVTVGSTVLSRPAYQVKQVDSSEYLEYHASAFPEAFTLSQKDLQVITLLDQDLYYAEILALEPENLILRIYQSTFLLNKLSDETNRMEIQIKAPSQEAELAPVEEREPVLSGVLLGLRSNTAEQLAGEAVHSYRTLWISAVDQALNPILEIDGIIFPRRSGFWTLQVERITQKGGIQDYLLVSNVATQPALQEKVLNRVTGNTLGNLYRRIDYIGNDYVSIEEGSWKEEEPTLIQAPTLKVLAVDSLPEIKAVSMKDLMGNEGIKAMEAGAQTVAGAEGLPESWVRNTRNLENFGLVRRMGHWFFNGRWTQTQGGDTLVKEYSIPLIPPKKLIFYDDQILSWSQVKEKIEKALDVFTSPNGDLSLVITEEEILVYGVEAGELSEEPLNRFPLSQGESVMMAEWATGFYVDNWENTLQNYLNAKK